PLPADARQTRPPPAFAPPHAHSSPAAARTTPPCRAPAPAAHPADAAHPERSPTPHPPAARRTVVRPSRTHAEWNIGVHSVQPWPNPGARSRPAPIALPRERTAPAASRNDARTPAI